ncbi:MAG: hypothetical protein HC843_11515 [Sphingomonadales bacterium]|nr:hypothetical protein [Sphingomonadales bacterium]
MPSDSQLVASSIEEMLVSLAGGIREAQDALNDLPAFDSFGRPSPTYFIPHLDFEFDVEMRTETNNQGRPILKVWNPGSNNEQESKITSKISGRLVAVPAGEGVPIPVITMTITKQEGKNIEIAITARNNLGDILVGQQVEVNVDSEASKKISAGNNPALPNVQFSSAIVTTDENGAASTNLTIGSGGGAGKQLLLVATMGPSSAKLLIDTGATS